MLAELKPMQVHEEICSLRTEMNMVISRVQLLESLNQPPSNQPVQLSNQPTLPNQPAQANLSSLTNLPNNPTTCSPQQCLGFSPFSGAELENQTPVEAVKTFLNNKMKIPTFICDTLNIKIMEIKPSKGSYSVFVDFNSVSIVQTILGHSRNLTSEYRILLYVPQDLYPTYRRLEEQAYKLRHCNSPKKTLIKWVENKLVLLVRSGTTNKWEPYFTGIPTTIPAIRSTLQTSSPPPTTYVPQPHSLPRPQNPPEPSTYRSYLSVLQSTPTPTHLPPNSGYLVLQPPSLQQPAALYNPQLHTTTEDTDGNIYSRSSAAVYHPTYSNNNQNQLEPLGNFHQGNFH